MRSERLVQTKRRCHLVSRMAGRLVCLMGAAALTCAGTEGPAAAMSKTWAYCRHYVLGRRSTFLHLSELSDAFEQRSYRAIGSSLCLAEYQPDGLWKETTIATRILSGGARIEVGLDALAELPGVLAGMVTWAPGSALLIDTRNGLVRISGRDLLGAPVVEKTGANDLIFTSPPVGVDEIRVREGNLHTSDPDLIPPAVKVLSLGGQFLNNGG